MDLPKHQKIEGYKTSYSNSWMRRLLNKLLKSILRKPCHPQKHSYGLDCIQEEINNSPVIASFHFSLDLCLTLLHMIYLQSSFFQTKAGVLPFNETKPRVKEYLWFKVLSFFLLEYSAIRFWGRSDNKFYSKGYACITSTFTTIIIGIQPRDVKAYTTYNSSSNGIKHLTEPDSYLS